MTILGIDYGRKKIGLALATTMLAEAYGVVRSESIREAIKKIKAVTEKERVEKIVTGISEGKMAQETKAFAKKLKREISLPIEYFDETLSTYEAQRLAREAGLKRKKRKEFEDAFAAAIMLQSYLDKYV